MNQHPHTKCDFCKKQAINLHKNDEARKVCENHLELNNCFLGELFLFQIGKISFEKVPKQQKECFICDKELDKSFLLKHPTDDNKKFVFNVTCNKHLEHRNKFYMKSELDEIKSKNKNQ